MAKLSRVTGSTSNVLEIFIQDSTSTSGAGKSGLAFGTSGLTCYYKRNKGTASVPVTLVTISTFGTFASGGFKEVDATNMTGVYEFHPPDAAFAASADSVAFLFQGATGMAPLTLEIELTAVNNQATSFGLSLAKTTNITGFNDIAASAVVSSGAITTSGGAVSTVTTTTTTTNLTNLPSIPSNWITAAGITAAALNGKGDWSTNGGVWDLATSGHTTSGSFGAAMVAAGSAGDPWATSLPGSYGSGTAGNIVGNNINATITSRLATSGYTVPPTTTQIATALWEDLTAGGDFGTTGSIGKLLVTNLDTNVSSRSTYAGGAVASVTAGVTVTTNNDKAGYSINLGQTGLSPRALDTVSDSSFTVGDALVAAICAAAGKEAVSGTVYTVQSPHTGTTIRTFTLDNGTTPTSRT